MSVLWFENSNLHSLLNTTLSSDVAVTVADAGNKLSKRFLVKSHYTLIVDNIGGNVSISPESSEGFPNGTYLAGTSVTLTSTGVENIIEFLGWSGDITSTDNEITLRMDCDKAVTATFDSIMEKIGMVSVEGGTYDQQGFSHTISDFSMGKYEVTYELWHAVYTWAITNGYCFANVGCEGAYWYSVGVNPTNRKYHPVTAINWRDCIVWCNAYSEIMGLTPVYKLGDDVLKDSRDDNGSNCDKVTCDWSANGYRLPTEGEWQFAASNGGNTPSTYASGATDDYNNADACEEVAWYNANSGYDTNPVGGKTANDLGLYDMSGNVREWCWDWYKSFYPYGPETDYRGAASGSYRVSRGGSWNGSAKALQVGCRSNINPDVESSSIGFRLVRVP